MKKKILSKVIVSIITASILLSGCGAQETNGEKENIHMNEEQEMDSENEVSTAAKEYEVFSEEVDAPGLSAMDWDLFNEIFNEQMSVIQGEDIQYEGVSLVGVSGHDLFKRVSSDPRTDWSLVSENFSTYYGNTDDGISNFIAHLIHSYVSGYSDREFSVATDEPVLKTLSIEPMYSNYFIDEGYSDIVYVKGDDPILSFSDEVIEDYLSLFPEVLEMYDTPESKMKFMAENVANHYGNYFISGRKVESYNYRLNHGSSLEEIGITAEDVNLLSAEMNYSLGYIRGLDDIVKNTYTDYYDLYCELVTSEIKLVSETDEEFKFLSSAYPEFGLEEVSGVLSYGELLKLTEDYVPMK